MGVGSYSNVGANLDAHVSGGGFRRTFPSLPVTPHAANHTRALIYPHFFIDKPWQDSNPNSQNVTRFRDHQCCYLGPPAENAQQTTSNPRKVRLRKKEQQKRLERGRNSTRGWSQTEANAQAHTTYQYFFITWGIGLGTRLDESPDHAHVSQPGGRVERGPAVDSTKTGFAASLDDGLNHLCRGVIGGYEEGAHPVGAGVVDIVATLPQQPLEETYVSLRTASHTGDE